MSGWQKMEERDAEMKANSNPNEKHINVVINKKNCKKYFIINKSIRNCTNAQDGQIMIMYRNEEGEIFVREFNEFWDKFVIFE